MSRTPSLPEIYAALLAEYGPQQWWPAHSRAEMMIGAILTQNTAWTQVEKALTSLRKHTTLDFQALKKLPKEQIAEWIRPAGYHNQKAGCLLAFADMLQDYNMALDPLFKLDTASLRKQLLAVKGIGPETADCMLLYAAKRPVFVVDAYTRRLLAHYGRTPESQAPYDDIAALFTAALPSEVPLYNEFHALIVRWGKDHPKPRKKNS